MENRRKTLEALLKNAILLTRETQTPAPGASKIGGKPYVPRDFVWPTYTSLGEECPLSLVAQINLAEAAPYDTGGVLPAVGMLYFFYEFSSMRWGYDPADEGCAQVIYTDRPVSELAEAAYPETLDLDYIVPESALRFASRRSLPDYFEELELFWPGGREQLTSGEYWDESEALGALEDIDAGDIFRLLGYPHPTQGSVLRESEMVSEGINCGGAVKLDAQQKAEIAAKSAEWVLLGQFGTLSDSLMFGDCGAIYYCIRRADLEARRFDRIHLTLQCG